MGADERGAGEGPATLSPEEAFRLLGDGTRIDVLRAVWASDDEPVPFSTLRERVGRPDSGQFNYHLNRLVGHFLTRVDGGYALTQAGREVVRAVLAGTMTRRPEATPARIDARCTACGGTLLVAYDEYARVVCADCGATVMWNEFPPAGLEGRAPGAVAVAFDRWTQGRFRLAMDGVCPSCAAGTTATVVEGAGDGNRDDPGRADRQRGDPGPAASAGTGVDDGDSDGSGTGTEPAKSVDDDAGSDGLVVDYRCENCRYEARVPLYCHALRHPAVVSRYHEVGVDVTRLPFWELRVLASPVVETVVSREPWRARVTLDVDGESLLVTLDEGFEVVDVVGEGERVRNGAADETHVDGERDADDVDDADDAHDDSPGEDGRERSDR